MPGAVSLLFHLHGLEPTHSLPVIGLTTGHILGMNSEATGKAHWLARGHPARVARPQRNKLLAERVQRHWTRLGATGIPTVHSLHRL